MDSVAEDVNMMIFFHQYIVAANQNFCYNLFHLQHDFDGFYVACLSARLRRSFRCSLVETVDLLQS